MNRHASSRYPGFVGNIAAQEAFIHEIDTAGIGAIKYYTSADGYSLNKRLRSGSPVKKDQAAMKVLDSLFESVPPLAEGIVVWRDIDVDFTKKPHEGRFITKGYTSTRSRDDQLKGTYPSGSQICCMYEIRVPAGAKVLPVKQYAEEPGEDEILLPRNGRFVVVGKEIREGVIWIVVDHIIETGKSKTTAKHTSTGKTKKTVEKMTEIALAKQLIEQLESGTFEAEYYDEDEKELYETFADFLKDFLPTHIDLITARCGLDKKVVKQLVLRK